MGKKFSGRMVNKPKNKNNIIIAAIVLIVMFGILAGSFMANSLAGDNQIRLTAYLNSFFEGYNLENVESSDVFKESFVKYAKVMLLVWAFAFVPFGFAAGGLVVFLKGVSYGFTTAFLVLAYGIKGIYYACLLYLMQNIILVPAYVFVLFSAIKFVYAKDRKVDAVDNFFEYSISLVISLACVILASFLEAYIVPNFITGL